MSVQVTYLSMSGIESLLKLTGYKGWGGGLLNMQVHTQVPEHSLTLARQFH